MIDDVRSKQGIPLISGPVPQNNFRNTVFQTDWPFAKDSQAAAKQKAAEYIDHTKYTVERYQALGPKVVNSYFPQDHTHTNAIGARGTYHSLFSCTRYPVLTNDRQ
jgi:rhamnogalacturonan acetylesterase